MHSGTNKLGRCIGGTKKAGAFGIYKWEWCIRGLGRVVGTGKRIRCKIGLRKGKGRERVSVGITI